MAKKKSEEPEVRIEEAPVAPPTFVLSADKHGHLQGLLALQACGLNVHDAIREFELWMDREA